MVRHECFKRVGTFDQEAFVRGEDWVMWMRIAALYPVYFLNEVLIHYRVHSQSYSRANLEKQFQDLSITLDKVEQAIPQLAARRELMREAKFQVCLRRGMDDLRNLATDRARDKLRLALRYEPWSAKAWVLFGIAHLPSQTLRKLRSSARGGRRLLGIRQ